MFFKMRLFPQSISLGYCVYFKNKNTFSSLKKGAQLYNCLRTKYIKAGGAFSPPPNVLSGIKNRIACVNFLSSSCIISTQRHSSTKPNITDYISKEKNTQVENEADLKIDPKNKARSIKFGFIAIISIITIAGVSFVIIYGKPPVDEFGRRFKDAYSEMVLPKQYIMRSIAEAKGLQKMMVEPSRELLLPDPLKEPYFQPPYTLVLEMKDVLVHPEWTYQNGWRFKKRPGVDFLLQHCAPPLFEIVIFTSEQGMTAYPVLEQLDANGFVWYRLFRDSTLYVDGKHLKDLNCLNRDLKKVVMVDWDKTAITSHRNQLCLKRWKGNMDDHTLVDLGLMLRTIAESEVDDVREVLDYYRNFDDPVFAFKQNHQAAEEQELERQKKVQEAASQKNYVAGLASSFLKRR